MKGNPCKHTRLLSKRKNESKVLQVKLENHKSPKGRLWFMMTYPSSKGCGNGRDAKAQDVTEQDPRKVCNEL